LAKGGKGAEKQSISGMLFSVKVLLYAPTMSWRLAGTPCPGRGPSKDVLHLVLFAFYYIAIWEAVCFGQVGHRDEAGAKPKRFAG
jgi:hypothetical protein